MTFFRILLAVSVVLASSCASQREQSEKTQLFSFEKTACFGQCPTYTMTFYSNGWVALNGRANIDKLGTYEMKLGKKEVKGLMEKLNKLGFCDLEEMYGMGISDFPSTKMTMTCSGAQKTVTAVVEMPENLIEFIDETHALLDEEKWEKISKNGFPD